MLAAEAMAEVVMVEDFTVEAAEVDHITEALVSVAIEVRHRAKLIVEPTRELIQEAAA